MSPIMEEKFSRNYQKSLSKLKDSKIPNKRSKLHRAYYSAVEVLERLQQKSGSLNGLMNRYSSDKCIKMIYALVVKVLKNQKTINKILDILPKFDKDDYLNCTMIKILVAELIFGEKSFLKYRLKNEVKFVSDNLCKNNRKGIEEENKNLIRYVRINRLKIDLKELLNKLDELQFKMKIYDKSEIDFEQFKLLALQLKPNDFVLDYHFDDLLVFNDQASKILTNSDLYHHGLIAMQDKSSFLAIESMNLQENMIIMDACAAPGMKTAAIASRLNNQCVLYAIDANRKRFNEMKSLLQKSKVKFKSLCLDFTKLDPNNYPNLDILLLDPSCSGSGINRRFEFSKSSNETQDEDDDPNGNNSTEDKRLERLAKFQLALLQASIPFQAKRIVYSTCSKYQCENEDVINSLLQSDPNLNYEVIDPFPEWPMRGVGDYPFSSLCLRASYESTLTNGFFCCVLQRKDSSDTILSEDIKISDSNNVSLEEKLECNQSVSEKGGERKENRKRKKKIKK
ncbi:putative 28S rRNA (cytosine-C(5))-methyltransferase [Sarcoptes scabiei]|uniref:Putative 28S rRNA (Cytosine-C(5))-methyltransferase n=1 Tax=Sarcoptes scabiei TaxID=52283 RepID=A0A131ZXA0_SARSC|nr:putative 28S rRNA (cytosine-C(5))-methyltransferase [Sarcoptes scabiei]KPM02905.1 williams-beuren syndrome critical region protein-like protein [Sarcoptes scabiei]